MKEFLQKIYKNLYNEDLVKVIVEECPVPPKYPLYEKALTFLGEDASPKDAAPDEYGCMETVDSIYKACFGEYINPAKLSLSTTETYRYLLSSTGFAEAQEGREGDIIISPTGYGNGGLTNGHVGILGKSNIIMSNNSSNGKWEENFTTTTWRARYVEKGGFPMRYFRKIN